MWKNVGALLLSVLLCLPLGEATSRFLYTKPWYEALVDEQVNKALQYNNNALGLRERNYSDDKPIGRSRVLILGDSIPVPMFASQSPPINFPLKRSTT